MSGKSASQSNLLSNLDSMLIDLSEIEMVSATRAQEHSRQSDFVLWEVYVSGVWGADCISLKGSH